MQQVHFEMEWRLFSFCDWNFVSSRLSAISIFFLVQALLQVFIRMSFPLKQRNFICTSKKPPSVNSENYDKTESSASLRTCSILWHNEIHSMSQQTSQSLLFFICHKIVTMECVRSCDQKPYLHNETKGGICIKIEFNPQKNISLFQHCHREVIWTHSNLLWNKIRGTLRDAYTMCQESH